MSNSQKPKNKSPTISSVSEFIVRINEIIKDDKESKFLFRGQEDEKWEVETSAYRRLKIESEHTEEDELYYNLGLIEQFKHADFHSGYSSKIMELDLGILAQLQHMGAATSLIDFSGNPLIALWFACEESINSNSSDNNNGKVFIVSTGGESKFEEIDSFKEIENSKVRVPKQVNFPKGNNILNNEKFLYWKPAHINNRITAQQAYFLIGKRKIPGIQELIIKGDCKRLILDDLSSVYGIERKILFPDLVGFVQANSVSSSYSKEKKLSTDRIIIRHYDEIVEKSIKDHDAYNDRGAIKYKLNNFQGAIDDFREAIEIDPSFAMAYSNSGSAKCRLNDFQGAINDFNEAIEIDPSSAMAYSNRGSAKFELRNYKGAFDDFNKAIELDPNYAMAYYNCGNAKLELKDYQGAIDYSTQYINIDPNYAKAYNNRGVAKLKLKDYKGAIDDYNKAIENNSNHADAYNNRGYIKCKLGDAQYGLKNYKGAIDYYQHAIHDYQTALKHSKDKNLTEKVNIELKQVEEKLKKSQDKFSKENK